MTRAGEFLKQVQFAREIGGVEFVLRRPNPVIGMKVYGHKLFGLVAAVNTADERRDAYEKNTGEAEREKHVREMLRLCMVSPRLGDESDVDADTVSYEELDLAGYASAVFAVLVDGEDVGVDFSESCEEPEAPASQDGSTASDNATE